MGGKAPMGDSSGGMVTKLAAAKVCLANGCRMVIADGKNPHPLSRIEAGESCTWFLPSANPRTARKRWIAGALKIVGTITVDGGALKALKQGKSLLPAGVIAIEGNFQKGAAVAVHTADGTEVARGLSAYSAADGRRIMGHKTGEIEGILGYRGRDEMIHRDDLVLG
jgi:glutamate 5-kinase